jgi:hypothetical protein
MNKKVKNAGPPTTDVLVERLKHVPVLPCGVLDIAEVARRELLYDEVERLRGEGTAPADPKNPANYAPS